MLRSYILYKYTGILLMNKPATSMPETGASVDALREAFGTDEINAIVRRGRAGEAVFLAREAGREFGTPLPAGWGWDSAGARERHFCTGCHGECVQTGARCSEHCARVNATGKRNT
ncbi:hypothetical protein [Paraburkholderia unamae]|nr:hypothetical protein [Paraburkholderia unamae]